MRARTKRQQLDALAASVTRMLPGDTGVDVTAYSGRMHIEETRDDGAIVVRVIRAGTSHEAYEFLYAMREALSLAQRGDES
jgi:hypothetical protein